MRLEYLELIFCLVLPAVHRALHLCGTRKVNSSHFLASKTRRRDEIRDSRGFNGEFFTPSVRNTEENELYFNQATQFKEDESQR